MHQPGDEDLPENWQNLSHRMNELTSNSYVPFTNGGVQPDSPAAEAMGEKILRINKALDDEVLQYPSGVRPQLLRHMDAQHYNGSFADMIWFSKQGPQKLIDWRSCQPHTERLATMDLENPERTYSSPSFFATELNDQRQAEQNATEDQRRAEQQPTQNRLQAEQLATYHHQQRIYESQQQELLADQMRAAAEEQRKTALRKELRRDPDVLLHRYREYIAMFPLNTDGGETPSTYHLTLLANQRTPHPDDTSDHAQVVRYAKARYYNFWTVRDEAVVLEFVKKEREKVRMGGGVRMQADLKGGGVVMGM